MYRSQLLLKQLGIQQWIPQQHSTANYKADELWRDQNVDTQAHTPLSVNIPSSIVREKSLHEQSANNHLSTHGQPSQQHVPQPIVESTVATSIESVELQHPATISFNCHVLVHDQFVVLAQIENEQQQRLFNNIQKACQASVFFMQWPLAIEAWDINDYVLQGYLQGVFATHQEKAIFSLGEQEFDLPYAFNQTLKKFGSLQQLLESAEQKRALWQALYPYVYDAETNNA